MHWDKFFKESELNKSIIFDMLNECVEAHVKQHRAKTVALEDTTNNSNERSIEFRSDYLSIEVSV